MLFCPSPEKKGEGGKCFHMFMVHSSQCSVQLMLFLIKKK